MIEALPRVQALSTAVGTWEHASLLSPVRCQFGWALRSGWVLSSPGYTAGPWGGLAGILIRDMGGGGKDTCGWETLTACFKNESLLCLYCISYVCISLN